jgi:hypothetical protein
MMFSFSGYRGVLRGAHHAAGIDTEGIEDFADRIVMPLSGRNA